MLVAFFAVFVRARTVTSWYGLCVLVLALVPIPLLQFAFGQIAFVGEAWLVSAYLLGLLLALLVGAQWEASARNQMMDALAFCLVAAGVGSVAIQLYQWLELGASFLSSGGGIGWQVWISEEGGDRPYANMGQPNLLASLLLWSLLGCAWGVMRRAIRPWLGVLLAMLLLFGVALTQSRTAWIGLACVWGAAWYWRRLWDAKRIPLVLTGLLLYFALCSVLVLTGSDWVALAPSLSSSTRVEMGLRPAAYWMFLDAALQSPWFGYGWNQIMVAHLSVAADHPPTAGIFYHSHNLFLEFVLWCGIPIGLLVSALLVVWLMRKCRQIDSAGSAIMLLFLVVIGVHAMLEFPLHFAFFLFPAGLIAGALEKRLNTRAIASTGRAPVLCLGVIAAGMLLLIGVDYVREIEPNTLALRFEAARIGNQAPKEAPKVIVLNQLRESLRLDRYQPRRDMPAEQLKWVEDVTRVNPTPSNLYKSAWALALNGRPQDAALWLLRARMVLEDSQWQTIRQAWVFRSRQEPLFAAVALPAAPGGASK